MTGLSGSRAVVPVGDTLRRVVATYQVLVWIWLMIQISVIFAAGQPGNRVVLAGAAVVATLWVGVTLWAARDARRLGSLAFVIVDGVIALSLRGGPLVIRISTKAAMSGESVETFCARNRAYRGSSLANESVSSRVPTRRRTTSIPRSSSAATGSGSLATDCTRGTYHRALVDSQLMPGARAPLSPHGELYMAVQTVSDLPALS